MNKNKKQKKMRFCDLRWFMQIVNLIEFGLQRFWLSSLTSFNSCLYHMCQAPVLLFIEKNSNEYFSHENSFDNFVILHCLYLYQVSPTCTCTAFTATSALLGWSPPIPLGLLVDLPLPIPWLRLSGPPLPLPPPVSLQSTLPLSLPRLTGLPVSLFLSVLGLDSLLLLD